MGLNGGIVEECDEGLFAGPFLRQATGAALNAAVRLAFAAVVVVTCFYGLLVYIPFTYYAVIQDPFLGWLDVFVVRYTYIYFIALLPLCAALLRKSTGERTKRLIRAFVVVHGVLGIVLAFSPRLDSLPHDFRCFVWSLVIPFPLCWLGLIDYSAFAEMNGWKRVPGRRTLAASAVLGAILSISLAFAATSFSRYETASHPSPWRVVPAMVISVASHLLLALFIFAVLGLVRELLRRAGAPATVEFAASGVLLWLAITVILRKLVLASLALNDVHATLFSVVFALQIAVFLTGLSLRIYSDCGDDAADAFSLPLFFLAPLFAKRRYLPLFWMGATIVASYSIPAMLAHRDWDSLLQRLCAIFIWFAALAYSFAGARRQPADKRQPVVMLLLIAGISFWAVRQVSGAGFLERFSRFEQRHYLSDAVEQYAGFDPSFKSVRDIVAPTLEDGEHGDFYRFLRLHTNLATPVPPVPIDFVGKLNRAPGKKPNIFLFVIDSLRPDYLSPYNPAVDFTPAIDRFARESDVMQNAFTRYTGTALAEPSIWSGAMQIHKQYVEPYSPMNALQKLVDAEHYQSYISFDHVLRAIQAEPIGTVLLDRDVKNQNYELCATLKEIERNIDARKDPRAPIFVYTQPMNVHVSGLYFSQARRQAHRQYVGFDADYAAELERLDGAFGEFVQFLKDRRLYDDSIIVLTADHGDSTGEYGRTSHIGAPFPELLKIPLIIHVPPKLRDGLMFDPKRVVFNVDITPTLYYLLGHRALTVNHILGRSMFAMTHDELVQGDQSNYLVASSYVPAYGILSGDGRTLFIADAQAGINYFFDLTTDPMGLHNRVTNEIRDEGERLIRERMVELNRFYRLN